MYHTRPTANLPDQLRSGVASIWCCAGKGFANQGLLAAGLAFATALLGAAETCQAGPLCDWLFGRKREVCCYPVAPAACQPACAQQVVRYAPQVSYRTAYYRVPVTQYRPVTYRDPVTCCPVTCMRPCTTYRWQARRIPTCNYVPVVTQMPTACGNTALPVSAATAVSPGCSSCSSGLPSSLGTTSVMPAPGSSLSSPAPYVSPAPQPGWGGGTLSAPPGATTIPGSPAPATTVPGSPTPAGSEPADFPPSLSPGAAPTTRNFGGAGSSSGNVNSGSAGGTGSTGSAHAGTVINPPLQNSGSSSRGNSPTEASGGADSASTSGLDPRFSFPWESGNPHQLQPVPDPEADAARPAVPQVHNSRDRTATLPAAPARSQDWPAPRLTRFAQHRLHAAGQRAALVGHRSAEPPVAKRDPQGLISQPAARASSLVAGGARRPATAAPPRQLDDAQLEALGLQLVSRQDGSATAPSSPAQLVPLPASWETASHDWRSSDGGSTEDARRRPAVPDGWRSKLAD